MRRYRITTPTIAGRWRATRELAKQDAVRTGLGRRDATTGIASMDSSVRFEIADGEADDAETDLLEGDALAVLVVHGAGAEVFARSQAVTALDTADRDRWLSVALEIEILRREARRG